MAKKKPTTETEEEVTTPTPEVTKPAVTESEHVDDLMILDWVDQLAQNTKEGRLVWAKTQDIGVVETTFVGNRILLSWATPQVPYLVINTQGTNLGINFGKPFGGSNKPLPTEPVEALIALVQKQLEEAALAQKQAKVSQTLQSVRALTAQLRRR